MPIVVCMHKTVHTQCKCTATAGMICCVLWRNLLCVRPLNLGNKTTEPSKVVWVSRVCLPFVDPWEHVHQIDTPPPSPPHVHPRRWGGTVT